jgi:hypothetical protein
MFRTLQINFINFEQLYPVHKWEYKNFHELHKRKIQIIYKLANKFEIILIGFDRERKWSTQSVSELNKIFEIINKMPMGYLQNLANLQSGDNLPKKCGFYHHSPKHCFRDSTHQTCCLLGKEARKYADTSGNPIGEAAEKAFYHNFGTYPDENTLTPWCTCIGSEVCSYYSEKFGKKDGTHIKFIHDFSGKSNNVINKLDNKKTNVVFDRNEGKYLLYKHRTTGVRGYTS